MTHQVLESQMMARWTSMLGRSSHRSHVSTLYAHSLYLTDGRRNERHSRSFHFRMNETGTWVTAHVLFGA